MGYGIQGQNYVAMYQESDSWPKNVSRVAKTKVIRKWELNTSITSGIPKHKISLWANVVAIYIYNVSKIIKSKIYTRG